MSIKDPVMMHSSGENGRKRKNDSDKRGAYRKFDEASSRMRESLLHSCAERVIAHAASNGGRDIVGPYVGTSDVFGIVTGESVIGDVVGDVVDIVSGESVSTEGGGGRESETMT